MHTCAHDVHVSSGLFNWLSHGTNQARYNLSEVTSCRAIDAQSFFQLIHHQSHFVPISFVTVCYIISTLTPTMLEGNTMSTLEMMPQDPWIAILLILTGS